MKECEKCKYLRRCSGKLVCGSSSSDNYDQYIELIDMCDVFGFNKRDDMQMPFQVENDSVNHARKKHRLDEWREIMQMD